MCPSICQFSLWGYAACGQISLVLRTVYCDRSGSELDRVESQSWAQAMVIFNFLFLCYSKLAWWKDIWRTNSCTGGIMSTSYQTSLSFKPVCEMTNCTLLQFVKCESQMLQWLKWEQEPYMCNFNNLLYSHTRFIRYYTSLYFTFYYIYTYNYISKVAVQKNVLCP